MSGEEALVLIEDLMPGSVSSPSRMRTPTPCVGSSPRRQLAGGELYTLKCYKRRERAAALLTASDSGHTGVSLKKRGLSTRKGCKSAGRHATRGREAAPTFSLQLTRALLHMPRPVLAKRPAKEAGEGRGREDPVSVNAVDVGVVSSTVIGRTLDNEEFAVILGYRCRVQ